MHTTVLQNNDWPQWLDVSDLKLAAQLTSYEINFTEYLSESSNQRQMFKKLDSEVRALGFTQVALLLLRNKFDAEHCVWSYPERDRSFYTDQRLFEKDLMLDRLLKDDKRITVFTQSMVETQLTVGGIDEEIHESNIEIISGIKQWGVNDYYDIAVPLIGEGKAILSVAAKHATPKETWVLAEKHRMKLAIMTQCVCHIGSSKFKVNFDQGYEALRPNSLNLQIVDCLANDDYQLGEIAQHLGISVSQVNKKIAETKKVLGIRNTTYLVTECVRRGYTKIRR